MPFPRWWCIGRQVSPPTPQPGRTADGTVAPPRPQQRALLAGPLARARTLPVAFLAVALLIPLLGLVAVREQYAASLRAAQIEAQHVAEPIAHTIAESSELDPRDNHPNLYQDPDRLQDYLSDIDRDLRRDMVVIGLDRRILADSIPANQGELFTHDPHGEVGATMRDGRPRSFTERSADYPQGILQMVIPLRTEEGRIVGAVLMEYTPIYRELLAASAGTRRLILAASGGGLLLALLVALLLARGLVGDLRQLALAAGRLAAGHDNAHAQVRTSGELGKLAVAFNDMAAQIAAQKAALTEVAISDPLTGLHNRRRSTPAWPKRPSAPAALAARSRRALYAAKRAGRNRVCGHTDLQPAPERA